MKRLLLSATFALSVMSGFAVQEVLLRVGGKEVTKQEFESYCRRHPSGCLHTASSTKILDDFVFRELKIADMRKKGVDTIPAFRQYCKVIQGKMLKSVLLDSERGERACRDLYLRGVGRLSDNGWVKMEQITIRLSQNATKREVSVARNRMDSVYTSLKSGVPFASFVSGDSALWCPVTGILQEFTDKLTQLPDGGFSEPFFSPLGIHIVRKLDDKPCASYEEAQPYLMEYLDRMGSANPALKPDILGAWTRDMLQDEAIRNCLDETQDELLASFWDELHLDFLTEEVAPKDLETYFKKHKERYVWEFPHFKGAVVWCENKKMASRIKKRLKRIPFADWNKELQLLMSEDTSVRAEMETGVFQIGTNVYVDKLAFKCGRLPEDMKYPYVFLVGKRLKKGPEEYTDVRKEVEDDYRREKEKEQITALMQRFEVEIEQDVLKTVNCCGSN